MIQIARIFKDFADSMVTGNSLSCFSIVRNSLWVILIAPLLLMTPLSEKVKVISITLHRISNAPQPLRGRQSIGQ